MVQKEIDYSKLSFNKCFELAHNGSVAAQYALGLKYYHGEGVKYNSEEAFKWIKKATEGALVEAHYRLGELYERGIGVKRNFSKALKCYERAAGKGYQDAQHYLSACYFRIGEAYRTGNSVLENHEKALNYFKKSAALGNDSAMYEIGCIFYRELNDIDKAFEWFEKAADNHHAWLILGKMYACGEGTEPNIDKASEYFCNHSNLDYSYNFVKEALLKTNFLGESIDEQNMWTGYTFYCVGMMYRNGDFIEKSDEDAAKWFKKAKDNGYNPSVALAASEYFD